MLSTTVFQCLHVSKDNSTCGLVGLGIEMLTFGFVDDWFTHWATCHPQVAQCYIVTSHLYIMNRCFVCWQSISCPIARPLYHLWFMKCQLPRCEVGYTIQGCCIKSYSSWYNIEASRNASWMTLPSAMGRLTLNYLKYNEKLFRGWTTIAEAAKRTSPQIRHGKALIIYELTHSWWIHTWDLNFTKCFRMRTVDMMTATVLTWGLLV